MIKSQDAFMVGFFVLAMLFQTFANALAAQRIPETYPLPDVMHEIFDFASELRGFNDDPRFQLSNKVCIGLAILLILCRVFFNQYTNTRKLFFIYSIMTFIRSISFFVTSLPSPCSGYPNCPCANHEYLSKLQNTSPLIISLSWTLGLGIFSPFPQCGDLIISGHTMYFWLGMHYLKETAFHYKGPLFSSIVTLLVLIPIVTAIFYIVLARNHYSVDVLLGIVLPELLWRIYSDAQIKCIMIPTSTQDLLTRFVGWFDPFYKNNSI